MATCETSESTSNPFIGIILVLLACCCYAFGNCLQRFSLLKQPGERVFKYLNRHVGWTVGALIYFSANGLYAIALSFAPVSVLAAVFSLTIVANAACARFLLGDAIPKLAYPGYALVLCGSILFSVTVNAQVCHFDGSELVEIMTSPQAIVYWIVLGGIIFGGAVFAARFEKKHPIVLEDSANAEEEAKNATAEAGSYFPADVVANEGGGEATTPAQNKEEVEAGAYVSADTIEANANTEEEHDQHKVGDHVLMEDHDEIDPRMLLLARFVYPASLGATEAVGALVLKAINSLFTTNVTTGDDEEEDVYNDTGLWVGFFTIGVFLFLSIVFWLRLVYARFEITGAFPVEFGMLTFASVVGGFAVFQDYNFINSVGEWIGVSIAGICILGGIGVVAWASWRAKIVEAEAAEAAHATGSGGGAYEVET